MAGRRGGGRRDRVGRAGRRLPASLTGRAELRESFDDESGRFRIDVRVMHPRLGPIFGYRGSFTTRYLDTDLVPGAVKPLREYAYR